MKKKWHTMRTAMLVFLTHKIALPMLKHTRRPGEVAYSQEELGLLPPGTLGHDLFLFLEKRKLPLLNHYMRHDLKHVLLEYDTTAEGEACLQCFMLGTGRISFPVIATISFALITMPEHWPAMREAYRKGRKAIFFHHWPWSRLLTEQTIELRNRIFKNN